MDRHFFNDHTTLVARSLRGLVASNPRLNLIPSQKVSRERRAASSERSELASSPGVCCARLLGVFVDPALPVYREPSDLRAVDSGLDTLGTFFS